MRQGWILLLAVLGLVALSGCATLSQSECETGDWRAVGISDGERGRPASQYNRHVNACEKYGVTVDRALYEAGRKEGLKSYCTLDNAVKYGLQGSTYANVCTGQIGTSFERVFKEARDVYRIEKEIDDVQDEIRHISQQLKDPGLSDAERNSLRRQLSRLADELQQLERKRRRAETEMRSVLAEERQRLQSLGIAG